MSLFKKEKKYSETEAYLVRQQNIDAILVLSGILDQTKDTGNTLPSKVEEKIKSLIDKI